MTKCMKTPLKAERRRGNVLEHLNYFHCGSKIAVMRNLGSSLFCLLNYHALLLFTYHT